MPEPPVPAGLDSAGARPESVGLDPAGARPAQSRLDCADTPAVPTGPGAPDIAPTPSAEQFRRAAARYATGIAVVTTRVEGVDHAMTANSFTTVSLDPLLALVCVERESRIHTAVLAAGVWSVSFLPAGAQDTARWFATRGRDLTGQFDRVATRRGHNGCVLLADGLAGLELRTEQVLPAGDHDIVLGAVTSVHEPHDEGGPLVYYASAFHALA
ncbi:MAG: flavin reductase family protein [Candidatus Nanopelagicales bacterium]